MRICFPLPPIERYSPVSGGAIATCVMQVASGLMRRGHDVSVIADNCGDPAYEAARLIPVDLRSGSALPRWRRALSKMRRRLHRYDWPRYDVYINEVVRAIRRAGEEPDVIVTENDLQAPALLRRAFPCARQVVWLHNEQGTQHRDPDRLFAAVDHVITNSDYIHRYTRERYRLVSLPFTVVHNGVDLKAFSPRPGFDESRLPVRVLFLGRIDPNKGVDLAVDAVAALREQGLPVEMTVAGGLWFFGHGREMDHPYFRDLDAKMQRARANYLGHVPREQVSATVREHDIVCVLSRSNEPFGLVALEAMASGCAVIASGRGGLPEACGGAAVMVDVDRPDEVASALRRLVTNPATLSAAKRRSVEHAAGADWGVATTAFETVLRTVVGEPVAEEQGVRRGAMEVVSAA